MALEPDLLTDILNTIQGNCIRVIENKKAGTYVAYNDEFKGRKYSYTLESYYVSYLVDLSNIAHSLDIEEDFMRETLQRDGSNILGKLRHHLIILNHKGAQILHEDGSQSLLLPTRSHAENKKYTSLCSLLYKP